MNGSRNLRFGTLILSLAGLSALQVAAVPLAAAPSVARAAKEARIDTGMIAGAGFTIAVSESWNRNVLIYAHGHRSEQAPISAELPLGNPAYARLIDEGWLLAATSYRRNGMIVRDAIADINALRDHIEETAGRPGLVILLGESMGGAIVTLMAENEPGRFHGAVAIGAALHVRDEVYPLALTHAPKLPLLFLTNESELSGPENYVAEAAGAPVPPVLWTVGRAGHVNVNHAERTLAIDGLIAWITTGQIEPSRDATVRLDSAAADADATVRLSDRAIRGAVASVTENHGNIFTSFTPEDLRGIGLSPDDGFELEAGGRIFRVRYGREFSDVPRGGWIAFDRAEDLLLIARNYGNAAATAGVAAGDPLVIRRLPAERPPD